MRRGPYPDYPIKTTCIDMVRKNSFITEEGIELIILSNGWVNIKAYFVEDEDMEEFIKFDMMLFSSRMLFMLNQWKHSISCISMRNIFVVNIRLLKHLILLTSMLMKTEC